MPGALVARQAGAEEEPEVARREADGDESASRPRCTVARRPAWRTTGCRGGSRRARARSGRTGRASSARRAARTRATRRHRRSGVPYRSMNGSTIMPKRDPDALAPLRHRTAPSRESRAGTRRTSADRAVRPGSRPRRGPGRACSRRSDHPARQVPCPRGAARSSCRRRWRARTSTPARVPRRSTRCRGRSGPRSRTWWRRRRGLRISARQLRDQRGRPVTRRVAQRQAIAPGHLPGADRAERHVADRRHRGRRSTTRP